MRQECAVGWVIVFKSIHRIRGNGRKRCENATSGRGFFENGETKLRFQTNSDTCGQGPRLQVTKVISVFCPFNIHRFFYSPSQKLGGECRVQAFKGTTLRIVWVPVLGPDWSRISKCNQTTLNSIQLLCSFSLLKRVWWPIIHFHQLSFSKINID